MLRANVPSSMLLRFHRRMNKLDFHVSITFGLSFSKYFCSGYLILFSISRFPFIACEVFTCEIDVILKTLVEEEEVALLFLFSVPHGYLEVDIVLISFFKLDFLF